MSKQLNIEQNFFSQKLILRSQTKFIVHFSTWDFSIKTITQDFLTCKRLREEISTKVHRIAEQNLRKHREIFIQLEKKLKKKYIFSKFFSSIRFYQLSKTWNNRSCVKAKMKDEGRSVTETEVKTRRKRKEERWKLCWWKKIKREGERKKERDSAPRAKKREAQKSQSLPLERAVLMNREEGVTQIIAHRTIILREQIGRRNNGWSNWKALPFSNNSLPWLLSSSYY